MKKSKGFISMDRDHPADDADYYRAEIEKELEINGLVKTRILQVNGIQGIVWEVKLPEVEALTERVAELENANARLYRMLTDEADRREARRIM